MEGRAVSIELFDGVVLELAPQEAFERSAGDELEGPLHTARVADRDPVEWHGQAAVGGTAVARAALVLVPDAGGYQLGGTIWAGDAVFELVPVDGDVHALRERDPAWNPLPDAAVDDVEEGGVVAASEDGPPLPELDGLFGDVTPMSHGGNHLVEIVVAYVDPGTTLQRRLRAIDAERDTAEVNSGLVNSEIELRVSLLGTIPVDYDQHPTDMRIDVTILADPNDVLGNLHSYRTSYGADLVGLYLNNQTNACGVAIDIPYAPDDPNAGQNPSIAWQVSALPCRGSPVYVMTHEFGHLLGGDHNEEDTTLQRPYSYSNGHYVDGLGRSVMSYATQCLDGNNTCPTQLQFSNPHVGFLNSPLVASGTAAHNNASSLRTMASTIEAYRSDTKSDSVWWGTQSRVFASTDIDVRLPFVITVGDYDGDGGDDAMMYFPGPGPDEMWWGSTPDSGSADSRSTFGSVTQRDAFEVNSGTQEPLAGDFDGDGFDDLFWYRPGTASDTIWWGQLLRSDFGTVSSSREVDGDYITIVGDFDGDGRDGIFWHTPGTAADYLWWGASRSTFGTTQTTYTVNQTYTDVASGDVDADGRHDIIWHRSGTATDYVWWGTARSLFGSGNQLKFNVSGTYELLIGNFDGDHSGLGGYDDIFWYAAGTAADSVWWGGLRADFGTSKSSATVNGTYDPAAGNFDGDRALLGGLDDILWFRD